MECLFQRHWHTEVKKIAHKYLEAETVYHDTSRDLGASMEVAENSLIVRKAIWQEHRPIAKIKEELRILPQLEGIEAYFNSGPAINQALARYNDPLMTSLFAETVKGIIQAETFLFKERGYAMADEYEDYWKKFYTGSCRYYSNLDRVKQHWYEHLGTTERGGILFSRFKQQTLYRVNSGNYFLQGTLSDSFHELSVSIELDEEKKVVNLEGKLLRCPDQICRESTVYLPQLKGKLLSGLTKKEVAHDLGKNQGCVHLIDLTNDLAQTLVLAFQNE